MADLYAPEFVAEMHKMRKTAEYLQRITGYSCTYFADAQDFSLKLLHEQHILVIPGSGFDWYEDIRFRIVMLPDPAALTKAMGDMAYFLKHHRV